MKVIFENCKESDKGFHLIYNKEYKKGKFIFVKKYNEEYAYLYSKDGIVYRENNLPAVVWNNFIHYCNEYGFHRTDGPARIGTEYGSYVKEYWLNGVEYKNIISNEYWIRFCKLQVFS